MTTNHTKRDPTAATLDIDDCGYVHVDESQPQFRCHVEGDDVWLEFYDRDRMRCDARGRRFVLVPLAALVGRLAEWQARGLT
jgi:hypothetical protein